MGSREWEFDVERLNQRMLLDFGRVLDYRPRQLAGRTVAMALAERMLRVRTRSGKIAPLKANDVQEEFELRRRQRNIVLKARQLGLTTWTAGRFFLKTITQPGTLTLQVAHTMDSAEEIFRIVHRFLDYMPDKLRKTCLKTSNDNARQIIFPQLDSQYRVVSAGERNAGRGLTIQNLHCSELARWPGDPAETLAGLRAALAPDGEQILESTPYGIGGCFYDEWHLAGETGTVQHFFPWWMERCYRAKAVDEASLSEEESALMERYGLSLSQIAYRRRVRANFHGLARQEFAEDEESCFLSSGDSVFEIEAVEKRLADAPSPAEKRRNGELEIWYPPLPGKKYLVAADPAGGGSDGDYSAAQILDLETGLQCAEFAGHVGGLELAELLVKIAGEYNSAWLVVERNNHGSGVLSLLQSVCHYTRLLEFQGGLGWLTTSANRLGMIGRLNAEIVERPDCFVSARLLTECRSFVRFANGATGARAGTHDDRVMAMAIGVAAREEMILNGMARRD
jgi:hypothetical protein